MPRQGRSNFRCLDCAIDTGKIKEYYMLVDSVWEQAHGSPYGMLCVGCVETRLGRELTPQDFNGSYLNWSGAVDKSQRLAQRMGLV